MNGAAATVSTSMPSPRTLGALVFVLAWLAYGIALAGDYVFDDVHSVSQNAALHDLSDIWRLCVDPSAFSATGQRMYRPALLLSFACNIALSPAAWSLKAGNVLLHATTAWLLFGWLCRLHVRPRAAFAVAACFAVHPLASEAVNLVSARSELLLACGAVLALRCHLAWQRRQSGAPALAGMLLGTLAACGSKETGVVLPVLMVAQELFVSHLDGRQTRWGRAVAGVLPVVFLVAGYLVLRKVLLGQAAVDLLARGGGDPTTGHGRTLLVQFATMGALLPRGVLQIVAPFGLTLDPPVTFRTSLADPWSLLGWTSLLAMCTAIVWPGPTAPLRRLGLCIAALLALPWIVIPLNMPLAEHRLYGPMLGASLVAAALLSRARSGARSEVPAEALGEAPAAGNRWRVAALVCALVLGVSLAARRSLHYVNEVSLWRHELAARPTSFQAWWGLGAALLRTGDAASAVEPLATACTLRPEHHDAQRNLVEALILLPDDAAQPVRTLSAAAAIGERSPDDPWVRTLQAQAHLQAGRVTGDREHFVEAERQALSCLQIAAAKGYVFRLAASARRGLGDPEGALVHLDESLRRGLDHVSVRLDRASVLRELGRGAEARRELQKAAQQEPMNPEVLQALYGAAAPPR